MGGRNDDVGLVITSFSVVAATAEGAAAEGAAAEGATAEGATAEGAAEDPTSCCREGGNDVEVDDDDVDDDDNDDDDDDDDDEDDEDEEAVSLPEKISLFFEVYTESVYFTIALPASATLSAKIHLQVTHGLAGRGSKYFFWLSQRIYFLQNVSGSKGAPHALPHIAKNWFCL